MSNFSTLKVCAPAATGPARPTADASANATNKCLFIRKPRRGSYTRDGESPMNELALHHVDELRKLPRIREVAAIGRFEVTRLQLRGHESRFSDRNVRIVGRIEDRDPLLVVANPLPQPGGGVIAARRFEAVAEIGVAH